MPEARESSTTETGLDEVVQRLRSHPAVDGVLVVGSASRDELNDASDYDVVVVLAAMPVPLHVGVTNINGRFADVLFHTTEQVEAFLQADAPLDWEEWTGRLVGWLGEGQILFDRRGRLLVAQQKAQSGSWIRPAGTTSGVAAWHGVNYNLQVARRYLTSDDPLYLEIADLRMALYGPSDLFFNYFAARRLRWHGEKTAINYLQVHDPDYLSLFKQFLAESDRWEKFKLYEELAARTVAPVGRLWRATETIMMVDADDVTPEMERRALGFWEELVADAG